MPFLRDAVIDDETYESGDLGINYPITFGEIDHNTYQEWGYWYLPISFPADGNDFIIDNKGYYILGDHTPDFAMSGLHGTFQYNGPAYGTYWSNAGGVDMEGGFSCNVSFDTESISNFSLVVTNGETGTALRSAAIENANGNFSGSQFKLNTGSGKWTLVNGLIPNDATNKACAGSLYGLNGECIGGAWGMQLLVNEGVVGVFQGDKH